MDVNINVDKLNHIILNMNMENYIIYYLFPIGYSLLALLLEFHSILMKHSKSNMDICMLECMPVYMPILYECASRRPLAAMWLPQGIHSSAARKGTIARAIIVLCKALFDTNIVKQLIFINIITIFDMDR